ncbi:DUF1893 domain-containing protein [Chloroflexota bacterium]
MYTDFFNEFLSSDNTLRVYSEDKLIFSSDKDRLLPLLEYLSTFSPRREQVVVFDKIVGNAAALLLVIADCREIYSPLGSQLAIKTLDKYGIKHNFLETVPFIQQANKVDMCPMEQLSLDKTPEEFHQVMKELTKQED